MEESCSQLQAGNFTVASIFHFQTFTQNGGLYLFVSAGRNGGGSG